MKRKPYKRVPIEVRFWAKVEKTDGCWKWLGAKTDLGYGVIGRGGRGEGLIKAPRVSWALHFGPIPEGLFVCHRCDNPECTRPDHLFLGTPRDNVQDAVAKGRNCPPPRFVGAANFKSKMVTHEGETHCLSEWARRRGVSYRTISDRLARGLPFAAAIAPGRTR